MSAAIRVEVPGFQKRKLEVKPAGWLGPRLLLDGERQQTIKGRFEVRNDDGVPCRIRFRRPFALDPVPILDLDGTRVEIARPLTTPEKGWLVAPLALVFVGGVIGGGLGALAIMMNERILRRKGSVVRRHLLCLGVSLLALTLLAFLEGLLSLVFPPRS